MKQTQNHPSPQTLAAFGLGRLPPTEQVEVERHIAGCDVCCRALRGVPDDTLLERLRDGATQADSRVTTAPAVPGVPAELIDHPRYRVVRVLGEGGMGVVYQAEHRIMERTVALKVLSRRLTSNPTAIERFRREVKAAAKLDHPNIVRAHDAEQAGELHFLVMEFVDGVSLARLVDPRGPLAVTTACQCIRQVALGLQHAHEQGMVHRDVKPQNVMLTRSGQVKVLDFGLARLGRLPGDDRPATALRLTALGTVLGTPDYLAPEQARDSRTADVRADLYSLGCTLYFLLAGHPPFPDGTAYEKVFSHLENVPAPLNAKRADVPAELVRVIDRMMAKDPAVRYQTPAEVAQALLPFVKAPAPAFRAVPASPVQPRVTSRLPVYLGVIAAAIVAGLLLFAGVWLASTGSPATRTTGAVGTTAPVVAATTPRVLLVVTREQVWEPDFGPVAGVLRPQARVTVASWSGGVSRGNQGTQIPTDRRLVDCRADEFDAVVFIGSAQIGEYTGRGPGTSEARRILDEAQKTQPPRYIGGLCAGIAVLADATLLDGKPATRPKNLAVLGRPEIRNCSAAWKDTDVVVADRLVTGSDARDADAFARKVLELLRPSS